MAYRELGVIEVREVLRRFCLGDGLRAIGAKATSTPSASSLPRPCAPSPGHHAPSPARRTPAGAAGTAHISLRARPLRPPGCERDARRAHRLRQAPNDPPGSARTTPRGAGTTAAATPRIDQGTTPRDSGGAGPPPRPPHPRLDLGGVDAPRVRLDVLPC